MDELGFFSLIAFQGLTKAFCRPDIANRGPTVVLIAIVDLGCNSESKDVATPGSEKPKETSSASTQPGATDATTTTKSDKAPTQTADASATKPDQPKSDVSPVPPSGATASKLELPKDLKHEGFDYEGLGRDKPLDMEISGSGIPSVITGSQTVTLKEVKNGVATYSVDRTGGLSALGSETASVEKDGVYISSSSMATLSSHAMDLPANPKPGMSWKYHLKADRADAQMDMDTTCKVIGIQAVKTKVKSYTDALLVEQDAQGTIRGKKARTVSKNWYVKGIGTVKAEQKVTYQDGKSETLTIQETTH